MTHRIEANWDTLLMQAKTTGQDYFWAAQRTLEASEMEYTAADVVALAQVMSDDFRTSSMGVAAQKLCDLLEELSMRLGCDE